MMHRRIWILTRAAILIITLLPLTVFLACGRNKLSGQEYAYVSAPQVNLRDRLSTVYTKVGTVQNGERVQVLEKNKRFCRVRGESGSEGWLEARYIVGVDVFDGFQKLKQENAAAPAQAHGLTRADLNMHLTPNRDGEHLYQLKEGEKLDILKRAVAEKQQTAVSPGPAPKTTVPAGSEKNISETTEAESSKIFEDWWLVRDSRQRVGWVLARMIDIDAPFDIAQYAEGQRIVSIFPLSYVNDVDPDTQKPKSVPQYLMLTTEPKDGLPFDFNRLRVFTWNQKKHRYELAYRESDLYGIFPVTIGHEAFDKEGDLPTFSLRVKTVNGDTVEKKYKLNGNVVRRAMTPAEEQAEKLDRAQRAAQRRAERQATKSNRP